MLLKSRFPRVRLTHMLAFIALAMWLAAYSLRIGSQAASLEKGTAPEGVHRIDAVGTLNYTTSQNARRFEKESIALPSQNVVGWNRCRQAACSKSAACESTNSTGVGKCCSLVLKELLVALKSFLSEKNNVYFYVMFGTLLGAQREADFIKWTSDLDIAVEAEFVNILEHIHEWNSKYYFWMENRHIGRMCITDYSDPNAKTWGAWDKIPTYVDVYVPRHVPQNESRFQESKTIFPVVSPCIFNTKDIYDDDLSTKKLLIDGLTVNVPGDAIKVLEHIYGENWNEPDLQRSAHGVRPCERDNRGHFNELVARANVLYS